MKHWMLLLLLIFCMGAHANEVMYDFKKGEDGKPVGWTFSSPDHVFIDSDELYQGKNSVRLVIPEHAPNGESWVFQRIPFHFKAEQIELRARVKVKRAEGGIGLQLSLFQDINRQRLEFSNSDFVVDEGAEWQQVRIIQKVSPHADSILFGADLYGPGQAWLSDIELWADGEKVVYLPDTPDLVASSTSKKLASLDPVDIAWSELSRQSAEQLAELIKVWGFIKYFHPNVAGGQYDWDLSFIESLHLLLEKNDLSQALTTLLETAGTPSYPTEELHTPTHQILELNASDWHAAQETYGDVIAEALQQLAMNRYKFGESRYAFADSMGLTTYAAENKIDAAGFEHELRLLALARLWNVIEYWFPYQQQLEGSWHAHLPTYIEKISQANTQADFHFVMQSLTSQLNDGHAELRPSVFTAGRCQQPVTVRYLDSQLVITQLHGDMLAADKLKLGDLLLAIDGVNLENKLQQLLPAFPASNAMSGHYYLSNKLLSRECESLPSRLLVGRDGEEIEVEVGNYVEARLVAGDHGLLGDSVQLLKGDITYIKLAGLNWDGVDEAFEQVRSTGKMIIDARGYPHDFVLYDVGGRLTHKPLEFAQLAQVDPSTPGQVQLIDFQPTLEPADSDYLAEVEAIIILVDEATMSQAEFSVMAWRELPRTLVLGSTTAGAIGNIRSLLLPDGTSVFFTGLRVLDTEGNDVQQVGIVPDIYVLPTMKDIQSGRDVLVDKAIEWFETNSN
ncbi:S41 family peptidase [Aliidiomarina quisquiliarum]|uniref:S41 family peptidase n=1 Tax=Aliidiomarina quisquiliarum TaxID=2938947 RepID=UPI00208E62F0|nr:S41 family peptidase [Aliidiomarina quisquiliarum]